MTKTYSAKPTEVTRKWHLIDAAEAPMGRIASISSQLLTGKGKPMYTPHIDCGDYVVIINAKKLKITGDKLRSKTYYRHSQYPGNLKEASLGQKMSKNPEFVIENAISGMLPKNKLRDMRLARLKVFEGEEHNHSAQKPIKYNIKERL